LPYTALTGTNGTDALKEFAEIVFTEYGSTLLESLIVKGKSLL
jgi:magnesium-transporting ATPase (P-type)